MQQNNHKNLEVTSLRERARRQLETIPKDLKDLSFDDIQKLIEELKIHQVELELQNEELRRAQSELQQTRDNYYELFDFAPVGYFTIDKNGLISEVNLTGADLLGYTRSYLLRNGFSRLVATGDQDAFFHHCKRVYQTRDPQSCELQLKRKDGSVLHAHLTTNVAPQDLEGDAKRLRVVVADITRLRQAEEALRDSHRMLEIKVRERTAALEDINRKLKLQVKAHEQSSVQIRSLSQKLLESQESERLMIARELHDSLAQELIAANMQCEQLLSGRHGDSSAPEKGLKKVSDILLGIIASVRSLAYDLRPAGLGQFGLVEMLQNYCRDYSELNRIEVDFLAAGFEKIAVDEFLAINLYRLLQESLLNIKKHAEASQVMIRLIVSGKNIQFRIHDNGIGFDIQQRLASLTSGKKLGLRNMQERVDLLNGFMEIDSKPGRGTKLNLKIPIGK